MHSVQPQNVQCLQPMLELEEFLFKWGSVNVEKSSLRGSNVFSLDKCNNTMPLLQALGV